MSRRYKLLLLGCLYLAQGLPYGFFMQALPVLLRESGMSLSTVMGSTSVMFLPWMLKFLWASPVDHVGTRRQWILPMQAGAILTALVLAQLDLHGRMPLILAGLFLFNVFAAIQDIATDGLAVRLLSSRERGLANGFQVGAYRIGMILGGGALLYVFAQAGWSVMFYAMAGILLLTSLPVLFLREDADLHSRAAAVPMRTLVAGWIARLRVRGIGTLLALVALYKFGDTMAASLVGTMMYDHGHAKEQIALIKGTVGSIMGLSGAAIGGWLAFHIGRRQTLLACGLLQTASLLLYATAAYAPGELQWIWAGSICEHLFGGMATVALFTLMMDASDPEHAGTDYTLLACVVVLAQGSAAFTGGSIADLAGYGVAYLTAFALSALGCLTLVFALDRGHGPQRLRQIWAPATVTDA